MSGHPHYWMRYPDLAHPIELTSGLWPPFRCDAFGQSTNERRSTRGRVSVTWPALSWLSTAARAESLKVLAYLIEHGDYEELHETIKRYGRQIERIRARRPQTRRH